MSGHSKWSTIKHKKAANDAARSGVFTKMANAVSVAVRKGGGIGDPDMNFSLRLAVDKARAVSMPKENIQRAIERGMGKGGEAAPQEMTIEGFAPHGVAVIIEVVTDNHNRTVAELRNLMEKHGGRMGEPGSVAYNFERCGIVNYRGSISDDLELSLIDFGVVDIVPEADGGVLYTHPDAVHTVVVAMREAGLTEVTGSLGYRPKTVVTVPDDASVLSFLEIVSENDDVQEVYANLA